MDLSRRRLAVATVGALAGCASSADTETVTRSSPTESATADGGGTLSAPMRSTPLALPMPREEITSEAESGGPPKDGIPAIDDPSFVTAEEATFLESADVVFGLRHEGTVRAYPQRILVQHEICNDTVAGTPIAVTYCPLTGTVLGFRRDGTTFGVSGRLLNSNLIMYDRATETWWPQVLATSIPGPWNVAPPEQSLQEVRLLWTTWERWRDEHPETTVLSTETGYARNYARDPYGDYTPKSGYYEDDQTLFPVLNADDRFHSKAVFLGARTPEGAIAVKKSSLRGDRIVEGAIGETPVLATYDPRYDTGYVYRNPESRAFEAEDGRVVTPDGEHVAPDAVPLERIHAFDAMWFAWHGFYPETDVVA
jgi:hypothetical protein